ncbi:DegV family protein [Schnuerera sp. xch1]|uniref:DegV family protein n=1 Tax=Schnuerera sp. xch1 TaxID=2874283 RepID=UPI001CBD6FFA|nr:DegV family protein [Schnuerera sp. xch1]MBZ2175000.1 DegV family protein [Schnuerera sp. xch1]
MGIRIVIDSTSDVTKEIIEKYNLIMVPLTVNFEDRSYLDKVELSTNEFFDKLIVSDKLPTTSQVTPGKFVEVFNKILEGGDEVLGIFLGSDLSGTYESAQIAKNMIDDERINLIDSRSVCLGTFSLILEATELVDQNKSIDEIVKTIESLKDKVELVVAVDTLKYLEKGGRLSKGQAIAGSILNIKPIITVKDSKVSVVDKVRGNNKIVKWFDNWIKENEFDLTNKTVFLYHAQNEKTIKTLRELIEEKYTPKNIIISEVGPVIGTHTGPGVIAIGFLNK